MTTTLKAAVASYLRAKTVARDTRNEYLSTVRKWEEWGGGAPIEELQHKEIREFLDWVYERAIAQKGMNPGRTANKAREHIRAVLRTRASRNCAPSPASGRGRTWELDRTSPGS
jgi:hypothetical protein